MEGKPKAERRQYTRRRVSLSIFVRILAEEETFSPFQYEAACANATIAGAMVLIPGISAEEYQVLFSRPRYMHIRFAFPSSEEPTRVFGRVVWHEYDDHSRPPVCRAAVAFEPIGPKERQALEQLLRQAAEL